MDLSLGQMILACLVMTVGAAVQGSVGFGAGLLAAPILVMIEPQLVPGSVLIAALVLGTLMLRREHQSIDVSGLCWVLAGRLPGTVIALATMAALPESGLVIAVGAMVILGAAISASGLHWGPTPATLTVSGILAGFMSTTSSVGGPPLALTYQRSAGDELRST